MNQEHFQADTSERLDTFLSAHMEASRSALAALIKKSCVLVNDTPATKPSHKLKAGDTVTVTLPEAPESDREHTPDFDIEIIYEDDEILVINKPSGVVVHPAPSYHGATLVDWLKLKGIRLSTISGEERHGIVHRIDKETSGVMVIAKTNIAHTKLSDQLQDRSMGRYYLALIDLPLKDHTVVEAPIARNPKNRLKMGIVPGGKSAKSAFAKLQLSDNEKTELIAAKLYSGRTHQIRVHLGSLNRHILGDALYGYKGNDSKIDRVFLHAYVLYLIHPASGEKMQFTAKLPHDFLDILNQAFTKDDYHEKITDSTIYHAFDTVDEWV